MRYVFLLLLIISQQAYSQTITAYQTLPVNAMANDNIKLVLTVFHGGCGGNFGYTVTRSANSLAVRGCYPAVTIAMPCITSDTVQLGRLPAGAYTVTTASYIAMTRTDCPSSTLAVGPPNATGSFTVGFALASHKNAATTWELAPTVVPTGVGTLALSNASSLQQAIIYDVSGRETARYTVAALPILNGSSQVPVLNLAPALYFVRVTDKMGYISTQRFIRQ